MTDINVKSYQATDIKMHKTVQLLAFLGKHLGEEQADDSHTTMVYSKVKKALVGKEIRVKGLAYRAELNLRSYLLKLVSTDKTETFEIIGQSIPEVLKKIASAMQIDSLPDFDLHYDLPEDYSIKTYQIEKASDELLKEWSEVRSTTNEVLEGVNSLLQPVSPVNIWPHHFDTGTYHVLEKDAEGDSGSIGTGFGMADGMVDEPYFYIYGWAKNKDIDYSKVPSLKHGEWKMTEHWKGAILPLSNALNLFDLPTAMQDFFATTSRFLREEISTKR